MVCLSMEDLKFASELADLIGSGREFHKRVALGMEVRIYPRAWDK